MQLEEVSSPMLLEEIRGVGSFRWMQHRGHEEWFFVDSSDRILAKIRQPLFGGEYRITAGCGDEGLEFVTLEAAKKRIEKYFGLRLS